MRKTRKVTANFCSVRSGRFHAAAIATIVIWSLAPAALAARHASTRSTPISTRQARTTLARDGYATVEVSCRPERGQAMCRWSGVRRGSRCSGRLSGERTPGRSVRVRVSDVRCLAIIIPARVPPLFGFNAYTTPQTVALQKDVGVTTTRLFVSWSQVEPSPGVWNWAAADQSYQQILAGGLRPLIVAYAAPCWAAAQGGCNPMYASPPNPSFDSDWITYVKDLVERYPQAIGIEIWNEPNLTASFWPSPDPGRYTQLLHEAYTAVKSVDASMPVISGGLLMDDGTGTGAGGEASQTYLAAMYADGASQWMDALGIHVYPVDVAAGGKPEVWDVAAMTRWLDQVQTLRTAADVPAKPIWITEMGVSTTTEPGFPVAATPQQQADDLVQMVSWSQSNPLVDAAFIDTLQDADPSLGEDAVSNLVGSIAGDDVFFNEVSEGLGVFTNTWGVKPAACALSVFLHGTVGGC